MSQLIPAPPPLGLADLLAGRSEKRLPSGHHLYKLVGTMAPFGFDVLADDVMDFDESKMTVRVPYADGNTRDGVGDLLEIGGIDTSRHQRNPVMLFDHGKGSHDKGYAAWPIAMAEDPETKAYLNDIDPVSKRAWLTGYFYRGKGIPGIDKKDEFDFAVHCEQIFHLITKGFFRSGSIGYQVKSAVEIPANYETGTPKGLHLRNVRMLEGSVVVMPANQDTVGKSFDPFREILCKNGVCGHPLSPYLAKSLEQYAGPAKAVLGWEPGRTYTKATGCPDGCDCGPCKGKPEMKGIHSLPPARFKVGDRVTSLTGTGNGTIVKIAGGGKTDHFGISAPREYVVKLDPDAKYGWGGREMNFGEDDIDPIGQKSLPVKTKAVTDPVTGLPVHGRPPFKTRVNRDGRGDEIGWDVVDTAGKVVDFYDDRPDAEAKARALNEAATRGKSLPAEEKATRVELGSHNAAQFVQPGVELVARNIILPTNFDPKSGGKFAATGEKLTAVALVGGGAQVKVRNQAGQEQVVGIRDVRLAHAPKLSPPVGPEARKIASEAPVGNPVKTLTKSETLPPAGGASGEAQKRAAQRAAIKRRIQLLSGPTLDQRPKDKAKVEQLKAQLAKLEGQKSYADNPLEARDDYGNPLSNGTTPPAAWRPGVGSVKAIRAKYRRKSLIEDKYYVLELFRDGFCKVGRFFDCGELAKAAGMSVDETTAALAELEREGVVRKQAGADRHIPEEVTYTRVKSMPGEAGAKSLSDVRLKYRAPARRRLRKSIPGASHLTVAAKDLAAAREMAEKKGLKFAELGNGPDGHTKVKLVGDDSAIDEVAKRYGKSLGVKAMPADKNSPHQIWVDEEMGEGVFHVDLVDKVSGKTPWSKGPFKSKDEAVRAGEAAARQLGVRVESVMGNDARGNPYKIKTLTGTKSMPNDTTEEDVLEQVDEAIDDAEARGDSEAVKALESYGAQVTRHLHARHKGALMENEEFLKLLDHEPTIKHLTKDQEHHTGQLDVLEKGWYKYFGDKGYDPLEDAEDVSDKDVSDTDLADSGDELPPVADDPTEIAGNVGEKGRLRAQIKRLKALVKSLEEAEADIIKSGPKSLGARGTKAKKKGGGDFGPRYEGALKWAEDNDMENPEDVAAAIANGPKSLRAALTKMFGIKGLDNEEETKDLSPEEAITTPADTTDGDVVVTGDIDTETSKDLEAHELAAVGEAKTFLKELSAPGSQFEDEHRMNSFHHHKQLSGIHSSYGGGAKSVPGSPEWAAEEAAEPEHKDLDPEQLDGLDTKTLDAEKLDALGQASDHLKALSMEKAFGDMHREKAAMCAKALDVVTGADEEPEVKSDEIDGEIPEGEPGSTGEKALKVVEDDDGAWLAIDGAGRPGQDRCLRFESRQEAQQFADKYNRGDYDAKQEFSNFADKSMDDDEKEEKDLDEDDKPKGEKSLNGSAVLKQTAEAVRLRKTLAALSRKLAG